MSTFDRLLALSALQKSGGSAYDDTELRQMIAELQNNEIKHINTNNDLTFETLLALPTGIYICDNYFHWSNNQVDVWIEEGQVIGIQPDQLIKISDNVVYWILPTEDGYNVIPIYFTNRNDFYKDWTMNEFNDQFKGKLYEVIGGEGIPHINQDNTMTFHDFIVLGDGLYYIDNQIEVEYEEADGNINIIFIRGLTQVANDRQNICCIPLEGSLHLNERYNPETGEPTGETYWFYQEYAYFSDYERLEARIAALESIGNAEEGAY